MVLRHSFTLTRIGRVQLVAADEHLTGLYFEDHQHPPAAPMIGNSTALEGDLLLTWAAGELNEYLAGTRQTFTVPLHAEGDAFSSAVWRRLRLIPYGETVTYGQLAREFGKQGLAQRIGQSVGRNPLCIFIPCHRVIGADGSLTGYAGGLERKRALLTLEEPPATHTNRLF